MQRVWAESELVAHFPILDVCLGHMSWISTLRKFFREKFFFSNALGYVLIVFAMPQIVFAASLGRIGVGRSFSNLRRMAWTYVLDLDT